MRASYLNPWHFKICSYIARFVKSELYNLQAGKRSCSVLYKHIFQKVLTVVQLTFLIEENVHFIFFPDSFPPVVQISDSNFVEIVMQIVCCFHTSTIISWAGQTGKEYLKIAVLI